jgi:uncharacterized protein (DUF2252 family)
MCTSFGKQDRMSSISERLQVFNQSRDPELLYIKYKAMRKDAFAFYRGTCHLFYEDWPPDSALNAAPKAWICGDLHWQNFGCYKGDNRLVYFNINDFDETVLAPCTWDLARLLVSIRVGTHALAMKETQADSICAAFLATYTRTLAQGCIRNVEEDQTKGIVRNLLFQVRTRNRGTFLDSRTTLANGRRSLTINGKHALGVRQEDRAAVSELIIQWAAQQIDPRRFAVIDVARRIAGVGGLGVERYVILVEGKGSSNHNYLLDLKAQPGSSLQPYLVLPQPHWQSEAERCVTVQHWVQTVPPALLMPIAFRNKSFVLRELQPSDDKINSDLLNGKVGRLEKLVKTLAKVTAWGQLRSAGHQGADTAYDFMDFASNTKWQKLLLEYACYYTRAVKQDYAEFCQAYDAGVFTESTASVVTSSEEQ